MSFVGGFGATTRGLIERMKARAEAESFAGSGKAPDSGSISSYVSHKLGMFSMLRKHSSKPQSLEGLKAQRSALQTRSDNLQTKIDSLEQFVDKLPPSFGFAAKQRLMVLKGMKAGVDAKLDKLDAKIAGMELVENDKVIIEDEGFLPKEAPEDVGWVAYDGPIFTTSMDEDGNITCGNAPAKEKPSESDSVVAVDATITETAEDMLPLQPIDLGFWNTQPTETDESDRNSEKKEDEALIE